MRRAIQVFLGETPVHVGVIHHDSQGARESAAFEYASEWLASPDVFALAPDLRLVAGPQFRKPTRNGSEDTDPEVSIAALMSVGPTFAWTIHEPGGSFRKSRPPSRVGAKKAAALE